MLALLYHQLNHSKMLPAALFQNIILDLSIDCQFSFILHHFFHINVDMCYQISQN